MFLEGQCSYLSRPQILQDSLDGVPDRDGFFTIDDADDDINAPPAYEKCDEELDLLSSVFFDDSFLRSRFFRPGLQITKLEMCLMSSPPLVITTKGQGTVNTLTWRLRLLMNTSTYAKNL